MWKRIQDLDFPKEIAPELLRENEIEVNRQHQTVGVILIMLFLIANVGSWIADSTRYFYVNLICSGCSAFLVLLVVLLNVITPKDSPLFKEICLSILYLPLLFGVVFAVDNYWMAFAIPVLLSCRYYNVRLVLAQSVCAQIALLIASILVAYIQPMLGYAVSGAVFLGEEVQLPASAGKWMNELAAELLQNGEVDRFFYWKSLYFVHIVPYAVTLLGISIVCLFITAQEIKILSRQSKALNQQRELDVKLAESRYRIMISQIQPHFIFNVLNSVYELCETDSKKAQEMVLDFATYLRNDLNSLNHQGEIPFSKELQMVQSYLKLERIRWEDRLTVRLEIETLNFKILPMTVQPIVENAVKHGICRKKVGGTIWIRTRTLPEGYEIQIEDDGVGFVVEECLKESDNHIGLQNVKARLESQMNGELKIESVPGEGTLVTIFIPKENVR